LLLVQVAQHLPFFSDLVGFASGIALIVPTHRDAVARKTLRSTRSHLIAVLQSADPTKRQQLISDLEKAEKKLGEFDERDLPWITWGIRLLLLAFAIKVISYLFL
jgi:hypothetical protein